MTNPLFHTDLDELKKVLRLTGIATGGDAECILQEAILFARVTMAEKLSLSQVTAVAATPYNPDPVTEAEVIRARYRLLEADLVMSELLCDMSFLSLDNSAAWPEIYDCEPTSLTDPSDAEYRRKKLLERIERTFAELGSDQVPGIQCFNIGAECPPPKNRVTHGYHGWYTESRWPYYYSRYRQG